MFLGTTEDRCVHLYEKPFVTFLAKMRRRGNISLKLVAQMLTKAGFNHIITVDMHSKESQGFFDCAIDNLRASPFLIQYIQESVSISCDKNLSR